MQGAKWTIIFLPQGRNLHTFLQLRLPETERPRIKACGGVRYFFERENGIAICGALCYNEAVRLYWCEESLPGCPLGGDGESFSGVSQSLFKIWRNAGLAQIFLLDKATQLQRKKML